MIYFICAFYQEAVPFLDKFKLKRQSDYVKYQVFSSDEMILLITGTGMISSAIAATYLFTMRNPTSSDIMINYGVCGCSKKKIPLGTTFLCNKLNDYCTKRTYYPDILFRHPFEEADITTYPTVQTTLSDKMSSLVDMEASSLYQAAEPFFKPNQIFFVKTVSDYLSQQPIEKETLQAIINRSSELIISWITCIHNATKEEFAATYSWNENATRLMSNLMLSVTMEHQFKQLLHFYSLQHTDIDEVVAQMEIESRNCKSKREGKQYFEQFRSQLIQ